MSEVDILKDMHEQLSNYIERLEETDSEAMEDVLEQATELLQAIDTAKDIL